MSLVGHLPILRVQFEHLEKSVHWDSIVSFRGIWASAEAEAEADSLNNGGFSCTSMKAKVKILSENDSEQTTEKLSYLVVLF